MKKHSTVFAVSAVALLAFGVAAGAQETSKVVTPLRIQVVLSKYQGEKKVSRTPGHQRNSVQLSERRQVWTRPLYQDGTGSFRNQQAWSYSLRANG